MRQWLVLVALLAAGCVNSGTLIPNDDDAGDDDDAVGDDDDATGNPDDMDGDGDPASTDCDDSDPNAFNGNAEACDDPVDNDCDPSTVCYRAQVGDQSVPMMPLASNRNVATWYEEAAIDGQDPVTESDTAVVLLYREEGQQRVHLVFTLDDWDDGSGGFALMSLQGLGNANLVLVDDQGEGEVSGGTGSFGFQWVDCCVDGAVIGPLDPGFCVDIGMPESEGLGGGWVVRDGGDAESMGPTSEVLQICETQ